MLSPAEQGLLQAFKVALGARFGGRLRELTLFGSRARGSGRDDSDLDVLVAVQAVSPAERRAIVELAADASVEHDLVLSPLVVGVDDGGRATTPPGLRTALERERRPL